MTSRFLNILLVMSSLLLMQCTTSKNASQVSLNPVSVKSNKASELPRYTPDRVWDILHTQVALQFNYKNASADGQVHLTLKPYFYPAQRLVLDAKSMEIASVNASSKKGSLALNFTADSMHIYIDFESPLADTISLDIKYTTFPNKAAKGGSAAITDDKGLYFINNRQKIKNKPVQIWTQGETESNSHWVPTIDLPNERFTTQITLTVPDSFQTLSNGRLVSSKAIDPLMREDSWEMNQPIQPYAMMFAIGKFSMHTTQFQQANDVRYYVEPDYAPYANMMFQNTPEMMQFFSNYTGVLYPWKTYSQIVVRDYVSGAMENTSASLFGEFMNQDSIAYADGNHEDVVSHELFHQWFGDYVTAESWSHLTVNESFANYGEQLWRTYKYGKAHADQLAYEDLQSYLMLAPYVDDPLYRVYYKSREDVFDHITYKKGGAILRHLHLLIGDAAFKQAIKKYLTTNALKPAEFQHWRLAVEEVTGRDMTWFFNQWYVKGGHPSLNFNYQFVDSIKKIKVYVEQKNEDPNFAYRLPMTFAIVENNLVSLHTVEINKAQQEVLLPVSSINAFVVPDYEHEVIGDIVEQKTAAVYSSQFLAPVNPVSKLIALDTICSNYIAKHKLSINFKEVLVKALNDSSIYALFVLDAINDHHQDKAVQTDFESPVYDLFVSTKNLLVKAAALKLLNVWLHAVPEAEMNTCLKSNSYKLRMEALQTNVLQHKADALILANAYLTENKNHFVIRSCFKILGQSTNVDDLNFMMQFANDMYGEDLNAVFSGLVKFVITNKNETFVNKAVFGLEKLYASETNAVTKNNYANQLRYLLKEIKSANNKNVEEQIKRMIN
jgi:aminopeptidase N